MLQVSQHVIHGPDRYLPTESKIVHNSRGPALYTQWSIPISHFIIILYSWFVTKYCQSFNTSYTLIFTIIPSIIHHWFQDSRLPFVVLFSPSELISIKYLELDM